MVLVATKAMSTEKVLRKPSTAFTLKRLPLGNISGYGRQSLLGTQERTPQALLFPPNRAHLTGSRASCSRTKFKSVQRLRHEASGFTARGGKEVTTLNTYAIAGPGLYGPRRSSRYHPQLRAKESEGMRE